MMAKETLLKFLQERKVMTEKEAIITLAYYNDWRQGKDEDAPMVKLEHVTEAIKTVIQKWKERNEEKTNSNAGDDKQAKIS